MRNFLFGGVRIHSGLANFALLVLRVFLGAAMVYIGLMKLPPSDGFVQLVAKIGFPMPLFFAFSAGILEVVGGALLALGLCTRLSALCIMAVLFVAVVFVHANDPFKERFLPLLVLFTSFQFLLIGSGSISIDAKLRGHAQAPE